MPVTIKGITYYRTSEVCQIVGISKSTFFRWVREGSFEDVGNVDRKGWRLFTKDDLNRLRSEASRVRPKEPKHRDSA